MAITKIQSESLNLADDFAFTGTITGAGGITQADTFRLTAGQSISGGTNTILTSNWSRANSTGQGYLGNGMTVDGNGEFSFPQTGLYYVTFTVAAEQNSDNRYVQARIWVTANNGTNYGYAAINGMFLQQTSSSDGQSNSITSSLIDVTDTSLVKMKFSVLPASTTYVTGTGSYNQTHVTFIRLGDT